MTHQEIRELLGAYAIHAVDRAEAEEVERHLELCPHCRGEVVEHREAAALLAHPGAAAPEGVWARIAASLEETPPKLDLRRVVAAPPSRRGWRSWLLAATTAAAAAVIAVLGVKLVEQDRRLGELTAVVEGRNVEQVAIGALVDPRARRVRLRSIDATRHAEAVLLPNGTGYLVRQDLPPLPVDRTYQLWAVVGDRKVSVGVLGRDPGITAFKVDPQSDVQALAVTAERAGGVVATDQVAVVMGEVPEG